MLTGHNKNCEHEAVKRDQRQGMLVCGVGKGIGVGCTLHRAGIRGGVPDA